MRVLLQHVRGLKRLPITPPRLAKVYQVCQVMWAGVVRKIARVGEWMAKG